MSPGLTLSEKILSRGAGKTVHAGDAIWARPDLIYLHDVLGPLSLKALEKMGVRENRYDGRIVLVTDHIFPPKDSASANNILTMKEYAETGRAEFIKGGEGIEHTLLIEKGIIQPGMLVLGTDSHTVTAGSVGAMGIGLGSTDIAATMALGKNWFIVPESIRVNLAGNFSQYVTGKDVILHLLGQLGNDGANYKAMEFSQAEGTHLSLDDRLAIANMTAEAGAEAGMVVPDEHEISGHYEKLGIESNLIQPDKDAVYDETFDVDLSGLEPVIAAPYSPSNVHPIKELSGTKVDQVYIGNCANGTISDLRQVAEVLKGRTVREKVKMIVVPATRKIYSQALDEGIIRIIIDAGANVMPSTCGACAGLHMGVLGKGEVAISNTNRNYRGRMGDPESKVYIANSYVAAVSALEGSIADPEAVL